MSTLCRMVVSMKYDDLPSKVANYAERSILDTMAVTIGGSAMEGIQTVVDFVRNKGGQPESVIPFYGGKVPASEAGFAIGPMSRAMDMGDVHPEAAHCSEYTLPTLMAASGLKDKVSGKEFITAFVVGQEVMVRVGLAFRTVTEAQPGGRTGGHCIFGCVAAAGKLLGLSLEELENAEGIARAMTQPHDLTMYNPASLIVRMHHGFVCQDAINACLLAKRGITGPREVLAAPRGYLGFAKWGTDPAAVTRGLGEQWEMLGTMMKPYATCSMALTAIAGILDQMKEHYFKAEDIATICLDVRPQVSVLFEPRDVKWNPQNAQECQFSLPYVVATAAYDKDVFLDSYTPQAMARTAVRNLMARISVNGDSSLPPFASRISTTVMDGRTLSKEYRYAKGHPKNPLTEKDLIDKFKKCVPYSAFELSLEVVRSLIESILTLDDVEDVVASLIAPMTPRRPTPPNIIFRRQAYP